MPHGNGNGYKRPQELEELASRIKNAADKADMAFWTEIARAFPEAIGGDFPPDVNFAWEKARDEALYSWLVLNHPKPELIQAIRNRLT